MSLCVCVCISGHSARTADSIGDGGGTDRRAETPGSRKVVAIDTKFGTEMEFNERNSIAYVIS